MQRVIAFIVGLNLLAMAGCTNRAGGPFAQNSRVPAPGTYQLRIPSQANNQPYYVPSGTSTAANLPINPQINPASAAPTINVANQDLNGWKLTNQPAVQPSNAPVYNSPYVLANHGGYSPPNYQVASSTTLTTSNGTTPANQGQTLAVQTRVDSTRLSATDASAVRVPSISQPNPGSAPPPAPNQYAGNVEVYQGIYPPNGTNPNGFSNPNAAGRFAAQPVVGAPGSYQSPYIRQNGTFARGTTDPFGLAPTGWVAREGGSTNR